MVNCNVCHGDYDALIIEDGLFYCSEECYNVAKANPELFKQALRENIPLL